MIVVTGTFNLKPEAVDAVHAAATVMMTESNKEDGCLHYRFYADVEHRHIMHVYEEWASDAHLVAHAASAHMAAYRKELSEIGGVISRDVKKTEVADDAWSSL